MNYKNEYDHYWSQEDRFGEKSFESEDSLAQDIISAVGYGRILDIGSGMGDLVISLLHNGVDAMGLDVSSIAVNGANEKASGRFIEGSVLSLPFEDNSFETIISTDCLEHLSPEDVVIALREIHRVCKKNIYFIIAITQDRENHYNLTVENRAWWEQRFYEAGFRKHPSYYEANNYESLQDDSWQIKIVLEKIPIEVLKRYPLEVLVEERDLHTDMTREVGERSDAHIYRYFEAAKYIRYGDTVLDAACGLGYGSSLLYNNSLASKVMGIDGSKYGIDYATMNFGLEQSVVFQEGYLPDALHVIPDSSIDFIVSFETLEHVDKPMELLAEFYRILTPGGRIFISVPNDWSDETGEDPNPFHLHVYNWEKIKLQMEQYFDIELSFAQSATRCKDEKTNFTDWKMCKRQWIPINKEIKGSLIECEWLIMSGMKNPNINNVEYRETVFPFNNQDNNVIAFSRDYENPWLIRSMISIGMRSNNTNLLMKFANEILLKSLDKSSADYGAALCVLAYQLFEQKQLKTISDYIIKIDNYIENSIKNPNQFRWQVSLTYFVAIYYKEIGNFDKALSYFAKCGNYNVLLYHPSLGTKVIDSLYWAGLITNNLQNDYSISKSFWEKGIKVAFQLVAVNSKDIYDSLENPLVFAIDEMEVVLDTARKCANALYAKSFNSNDSYFAKFISNSRITYTAKLEKEIKNYDYLNKSLESKEQWIDELQKGKDWLESQNNILKESLESKEQWIDELQKGKDWLESQNNILKESLESKEQWIDELQKGKDWLESQNNILKESLESKEQWIDELQKGKDCLLNDNKDKEQFLELKNKNLEGTND